MPQCDAFFMKDRSDVLLLQIQPQKTYAIATEGIAASKTYLVCSTITDFTGWSTEPTLCGKSAGLGPNYCCLEGRPWSGAVIPTSAWRASEIHLRYRMLLLFGVRIDIGIHTAQLSPTKGREISREAAQIFRASLLITIVRPVLGQKWLEAPEQQPRHLLGSIKGTAH
jgi:hypothetical protein